MSGRSAIDALLILLDDEFRGPGIEESNESQAFLPNLVSAPDAVWRALPPGAARSIESIVLHVGSCKIMYDDHAFCGGSLEWGTSQAEPWSAGAPRAAVTRWIEDAHDRLAGHVAALDDDSELDRLRPTNWGESRPTRWIIGAMITHDAYHAGEINHIRSILGPDDRWRYIQAGFG